MTKKDYILIEKSISDARKDVASNYTEHLALDLRMSGITMVEDRLAMELSSDNPKFDFDKFHKACKLTIAV